jgi:NADH dehydrogenase FAD-containing subunit
MAGAPAQITLVDPKDYVEVPFATLRALMDPAGFGKTVRRPISSQFSVDHVQAKLAELRADSALLDDGREIAFDYAVLATGSTIRGFDGLKVAETRTQVEREAEWAAAHDRLAGAENVVIVGGGPIGVELAGEITAAYPGKRVTLIHASDRLLPALGKGASRKAQRVLEQHGVRIVLGQRATVAADGGSVRLASGETVPADAAYVATGIAIDTSYLEAVFPKALNAAGQAKVDRYLRLAGSERIFALGDINDVPQIKLGAFAARQAKLTAKNVSALLERRPLKAFRPITGTVGYVTLGRKAGIVQLPFGRVDPLIATKQKDMYVSRYLSRGSHPLEAVPVGRHVGPRPHLDRPRAPGGGANG